MPPQLVSRYVPILESFPTSAPEPHRRFLEDLVLRLSGDPRIVGTAAGGSYVTDSMAAFSDLDLVIVVETRDYPEVVDDRLRDCSTPERCRSGVAE